MFGSLLRRGGRGRARALILQADRARDERQYRAAAALYEAALRLRPNHAGAHVQCGHMWKEAGDLQRAQTHYLAARELIPDDPDLALQLGHFYKVAGRLEACEASYRRALELRPGWQEAARELAELRRRFRSSLDVEVAAGVDVDRLVPELLPQPPEELVRTYGEMVQIRRLGARTERTRWGTVATLRGVEAIRGFCVSSVALSELEIQLDGRALHRASLRRFALGDGGQAKYVFNAWLDFSGVAPGPHRVRLSFRGGGREVRGHAEGVVVAAAVSEAAFADCDGVVEVAASDPRDVEAQIHARPSVVRPAARSLLRGPVRNVLVLRTDQLGDLVTSIPALRRLRELFADARIVGLLTAANADFGRTLGLFDEIVVVDFPDDPVERRRIMTLEAQIALRAKLEPYAFDIALDLAESAVSRPLLLLSGARFLYGFNDREWPWLNGGFEGNNHDPHNRLEIAAQSTKVVGLVERLAASLASRAEVIRRPELTREMLAPFGLADTGRRFAVMHTGARIAFSRWPHYPALAALILERTDLDVAILTDDAAFSATLPPALAGSERFRLVAGRMAFDNFDALVSFAAVFVGNDSGPKHLAALRGTPVVSIHSARINWNEWGQELTGSIVSRRVPCAGCAIFHDDDECGQDFACVTRITAEEVFGAVAAQLAAAG